MLDTTQLDSGIFRLTHTAPGLGIKYAELAKVPYEQVMSQTSQCIMYQEGLFTCPPCGYADAICPDIHHELWPQPRKRPA